MKWKCPKCGRIFAKKNQMHSCKKFPLEKHFENKEFAKELYDELLKIIKDKIGKVDVISLPCCIHLYGNYDFLAILPKKDKIEIRIALDRKIKDKRIFACVPLSKTTYKNCFYISAVEDINKKIINWINDSYHFKS
jgi:hypothetical protein